MRPPSDLSFSMSSSRLQSALQQKSNELALSSVTGEAADKSSHLNGIIMPLSLAERRHDLLLQEKSNIAEAKIKLEAAQNTLAQIERVSQDTLTDYASSDQLQARDQLIGLSNQAETAFENIVSLLNTQISGKYHFSGLNTQNAPIPSGEAMLDGIKAQIIPPVTADAAIQIVKDWFEFPSGDYYTSVYQGTEDSIENLLTDDLNSIGYDKSAISGEIVQTLSALAVAALGTSSSSSFSKIDLKNLIYESRSGLLQAVPALINAQSSLGRDQKLVEETSLRVEEDLQFLSSQKSEMININQFDTVSAYEQVSGQLDIFYQVIGRRNQITLQGYLK